MEKSEILKKVDHTLLAQSASWQDIKTICDDACRFGTASVCIPPSYVERAVQYLEGRMPVCTVIGFPNGYSTTAAKAFEAEDAIKNGAREIDMVINIGSVKNGDFNAVSAEIELLRRVCAGRVLKVIIETCLLTREEKIRMCRIVTDAGADFIKTSTGFSSGGATFEDVELFAANIGGGVQIKAAGGISSFADAERFIELGASRLGTSRLVKIMKQEEAQVCGADK